MTYGDGLSDVDISASIVFHRQHGGTSHHRSAAAGTVRRAGHGWNRYHVISGETARRRGWINGGFFVLSPKVLDEIHSDAWMFEREPMSSLTAQRQVHAFRHSGFWQAMDTLRDKQRLEELWAGGRAPWKMW
jgi:glucose-1-phosphate cytidylyltransferase